MTDNNKNLVAFLLVVIVLWALIAPDDRVDVTFPETEYIVPDKGREVYKYNWTSSSYQYEDELRPDQRPRMQPGGNLKSREKMTSYPDLWVGVNEPIKVEGTIYVKPK